MGTYAKERCEGSDRTGAAIARATGEVLTAVARYTPRSALARFQSVGRR